MSEVVILALIAQVGTLITVIITAIFGRKKLDRIDGLVNGTTDQLLAQNDKLRQSIRELENLRVSVNSYGKDGQS